LIVVEDKTALMKKMGKKQLTLHLAAPLAAIPPGLADWALALKDDGRQLEYVFDAKALDSKDGGSGIPALLKRLADLGIGFSDLHTEQSSLEDIFVSLVSERPSASPREARP
jgi:ABC-2 type transport system ATP-binding protein